MPVPQPLMNPLTLYRIAQQYWDLRAIPRPRTFEILALNCKNELEKEKLMEFSSPSGQDDLFSYANRPRRTILEVLSDFPHATSQLTIPVLFELFNTIKPRSFSIASCMESNKLDLLVAVVQYKTILKAPRLGLCSNWLKGLLPKQRIIATVKKGTFSFPNNPLIPLIMVGPGTGLAPFRSFLQHNELVEKRSSKIVIFFGCRNKSKDYHCNEDLERMVSLKHIQLFVAFSRDQDEKVYVQHLIEMQKELLNELISNGGYIYVAGSSKNMPKSVKEAFENVAGYQTISEMIKNRRYQEETWA